MNQRFRVGFPACTDWLGIVFLSFTGIPPLIDFIYENYIVLYFVL